MKRLLIILFFLAPLVGYSQTNYTALGGPYNGTPTKMVKSNGALIGITPGGGIYRSTDSGANWIRSNTGINNYYFNDIIQDEATGKIFAITSNQVFTSIDDGQNWILAANTGFSSARFIRKSPNGSFFIVASNSVVYRSTNGGTTWSVRNNTLPTNSPNDFEINGSGNLFITLQGSGVYRSTDNGLGFTLVNTGITDLSVYSLLINGSDLYVVAYSDVYKSTTNGASWVSTKGAGVTGITDCCFQYHSSIEKDPAGNIYIFNTEKIWKSVDGGVNWSSFNSPIPAGLYEELSDPFFESSSEFYVGVMQIALYKTTNSGANWFASNTGISSIVDSDLLITDNGRLLTTTGYGYGINISTDDGVNWDYLASGATARQIRGLSKSGSTILGYGQGLIKSTDNGSSWTVQSEGSWYEFVQGTGNNVFAITNTYVDPNYVYALYRSNDLGATYATVTVSGMPSASTSYVNDFGNVFADASDNIYVMIYDYATGVNQQKIFKINSTTGVATQIINVPGGATVLRDIYFNNGKLYVLTSNNQLHISSDEGQTWTTKATPVGFGRIKVFTDNTLYLLNSNVYISNDAGTSWTNTENLATISFNQYVKDVEISSTNFSYLSVPFNVVHKSNAPVIPPAAPTNLSVYGYSAFNVGIKWDDNSNNESYFIIERSEGNNTSYDSITTHPANGAAFVIRNIGAPKDNTVYYYRVRAVGAAGNSAYSNEVSVTTVQNCQNYTIPVNRSWTSNTQSIVGSNNPVSITGGNGTYIISNLVTTPSVAGLSPGLPTSIQVQVQEVCGAVYLLTSNQVYGDGNGTWDAVTNTLTVHWQTRPNVTPYRSETTIFTLNAVDPAPAPPTNVGAYVKTQNEIVVTWAGSLYAQEYQVQRSTTSGSGFVDVGSPVTTAPLLLVDNNTFTIGTTYYYRIVAESSGGGTSTSSEISIQFQTPLFDAINLVGFDHPSQGISWIDLENDGDDDLLITPFNAPNQPIAVFENDGAGNLAKIAVPGISDYDFLLNLASSTLRVISVADINNDGLTDFLSHGSQTGADIWMNQGNKQFERTSLLPPDNSGLAWYASLADFNNDGRMDAVAAQDAIAAVPPTTAMKFFTQNVGGEFEPYEIGEIVADLSVSRSGSWADYDNDGDQDFLRSRFNTTASEFDQLYRNEGNGIFTPVTGTAFENDYLLGSRSINWGDYDNDLDLDVYIVNNVNLEPNMLYRNNGDGTFTRMTGSLLSEPKTAQSFGSAWGDIDNDGDLDMIVANSLQSILYINDGAGNFSKYLGQEYLVGVDATRTNISFAFSDYDNNGTLDIAAGKNQTNFPTILLKNRLTVGANTRWLKIKLNGTTSNRSGIGARIVITTPDTKKQMRSIESLSGYGSASSLTAHFGLKNQTSATVEVFWPSGIHQTITNVAANQTLTVVDEDGVGPVASVLVPANTASDVNTNTTISITLNETVIPVAGKNLSLFRESDLVTPIATFAVTTATVSGNTYTFTPAQKLLTNTAYVISLDVGAFRDIYSNTSLAIPTSNWRFTTNPGPQLLSTLPTANVTDVLVTTTLEINFNRDITAVAGKAIRVLNGSTNLIISDVSTAGVVSGSRYTLTPSEALPYLTALEVQVDEGAFVDANQNNSAAIPAGQWNFTTIEQPDETSPVISFDPAPLNELEKGFAAFNATIVATDNKAVTSVTLHRRKISEANFVTSTATGSGSQWTVQIQNTFADDMGFEYYIETSDAAGNIARNPLTETQFYQSRIKFSSSNAPKVSITGGGTINGWRIISIPYQLGNNNYQISDLFSNLGAASESTWRMIRYTNAPAEAWLEYPAGFSTVERGKGYFINAFNSSEIQFNNAIAPNYNRNNLFSLSLVQGWNQIGNPYSVAINWEDVRTFNNASANVGALRLFTNGAYTAGTSIQPLQGGFVFLQTATTVQIPFPGQAPGGRTEQTTSSDLNANNWQVGLTITHHEIQNEFGGIGMHQQASVSFDQFDDVSAPRFFDYSELNFSHPEHFAKRFARDVVPTAAEHVWEFSVDTNQDGYATLAWDNTGFGDNKRELYLFDVVLQQAVDMRVVSSYVFDPRESSRFKIYYGEDLLSELLPNNIQLGKAYPNPSEGRVSIPFSLPAAGGNAQHVSIEVIDAMGRSLGSVAEGTYSAGYHTVAWNGTERTSTDGLYIFKIIVDNDQGKQHLQTRILMKK